MIVLADSAMWGVIGLADIGPLTIATTVISDEGLPADGRRALGERVDLLITVEVSEP